MLEWVDKENSPFVLHLFLPECFLRMKCLVIVALFVAWLTFSWWECEDLPHRAFFLAICWLETRNIWEWRWGYWYSSLSVIMKLKKNQNHISSPNKQSIWINKLNSLKMKDYCCIIKNKPSVLHLLDYKLEKPDLLVLYVKI